MRLHRGGDRQANRALHMIAVLRLRYDPRTIAYMERRRAEGLSKKDVLRCLKRFIARDVYNDLRADLLAPPAPAHLDVPIDGVSPGLAGEVGALLAS